MPAVITSAIPEQGFERVRDLIGAILLVELTNQQTLKSLTEELNIYTEKSTPSDSSDELEIVVTLANAEYGEMTQRDAQGKTIYFIDIYTSAETVPANGSTPATPGGYISGKRLHQYVGLCMYIFRAPYYRFMGLPLGLIGGTYIESFMLEDPHAKEDTDFTRFGRIKLAVRIQENTEQWSGIPLEINNTTVKLDLTEKGYKFVFNNP